MASRKNNFYPKLALLTFLIPQVLLADTSDVEKLQADFSKTALPILQRSCFACHGPKPQSTDNIQNPSLRKKAVKMIARAQKDFPMSEIFPFPRSEDPKDDLKVLRKSLRKGSMPPSSQKALNMGKPLSARDKKALLDWAARARKGLN